MIIEKRDIFTPLNEYEICNKMMKRDTWIVDLL